MIRILHCPRVSCCLMCSSSGILASLIHFVSTLLHTVELYPLADWFISCMSVSIVIFFLSWINFALCYMHLLTDLAVAHWNCCELLLRSLRIESQERKRKDYNEKKKASEREWFGLAWIWTHYLIQQNTSWLDSFQNEYCSFQCQLHMLLIPLVLSLCLIFVLIILF